MRARVGVRVGVRVKVGFRVGVKVGVRVGARVRGGRGAQPLLCRAGLSGFVPHERATH